MCHKSISSSHLAKAGCCVVAVAGGGRADGEAPPRLSQERGRRVGARASSEERGQGLGPEEAGVRRRRRHRCGVGNSMRTAEIVFVVSEKELTDQEMREKKFGPKLRVARIISRDD
jgi:hypothetical protein